jgi:hypothetical protein
MTANREATGAYPEEIKSIAKHEEVSPRKRLW